MECQLIGDKKSAQYIKMLVAGCMAISVAAVERNNLRKE